MPDILIAEFFDEEALELVPPHLTYEYDPSLVDDAERLRARLAESRSFILRSFIEVTADLLDAGPKLEVVGRIGVGLNNVDVDACAARNIQVLNTPGSNSVSVGEYAVTCALMLFKSGAFVGNAQMLAGDWPRRQMIGNEVEGRRFGVVGYGNAGRAAAQRAAGLGMEILANDPYVPDDDPRWQAARRCNLEELLEAADAVSLHVPLTDETRSLIGAAELAKMRKDAVLINAARGGVVDEFALVAALREGRLKGAALDVFEREPLTSADAEKFSGINNLILTPHIAGVTVESNVRTSKTIVQKVVAALDG